MRLSVNYLALLIACLCIVFSIDAASISDKIQKGVRQLIRTQKTSVKLTNLIKQLNEISDEKLRNGHVCRTCNNTVGEVIQLRRHGLNKESLRKHIYNLCLTFTNRPPTSCAGYIDIELDVILFIIDTKLDLTSERVCSIYLQTHGCVDPSRMDWSVTIPPPINETRYEKSLKGETKQVLQLTDFHYDPLYEPGNDGLCGLDLCCQRTNGKPLDPKNAAGFWGSYHSCDMPWHSVLNVLSHIKATYPDLEHVYYTGDIISHRSWDTSVVSNTDSIRRVYTQFYDTFGTTKVYPVLGNHEPHPTDFFSKFESNETVLTTQWLFNLVHDEWSRWLPSSALQTVKHGGYYTVLIRPGFRLIALNSNVCYTENLWLSFDDKDPYSQLQWLVNILALAESNNEMVHIISHVPPGSTKCLRNWNDVYHQIVDRFASTIKAQFNGHTHYDEFRLFYNKAKTEVTNVAFNGGSFTTFVGLNPNYRVYDVNYDNYEVVDYYQWTYNMTKANLRPDKSPEWYKIYTFRDTYGVGTMELDKLGKLVERMEKEPTLRVKYYKYHVRDSDVAPECDQVCLQNKVCAIRSTYFKDAIDCHDK